MSAVEILGQSHDGNSIWLRLDGDEFDVTPMDLAVARRSVQRGYRRRNLLGHTVDEQRLTDLIRAMDAPQPYWPPVLCEDGDCGTEATETVEDRKVCHGHAMSLTWREEEGTP